LFDRSQISRARQEFNSPPVHHNKQIVMGRIWDRLAALRAKEVQKWHNYGAQATLTQENNTNAANDNAPFEMALAA